MTRTPSPLPAARPRWRSIIATFALVGALVATTSAMSATADVVGSGPGTISGTVTSTGGEPLAGAFINVSISAGEGTPFSASTTTDAAGYYEFSGLELDSYGIQSIVSGYQAVAWQYATLTEGAPSSTVDFVAEPFAVGVGTISGHATGDGVPLAGLYITAYGATGQNVTAVTDEDGFYEFTGLANGDWNIFGSAGNEYQYLNLGAIHITAEAPNATADLPFISWPVGTASISGVVTDSLTGSPIADVHVSAFGTDVPHNSNWTTDETGAFSFDLLPAGTYLLNLWINGYLNHSEEVTVSADEAATANIALVATNATVSGHVKTKAGAPVAGIYVNATTADGNFGFGQTDENGDYVITDLGAVAYTLSVGGIGTPYKAKERVVTPVANGNITANFTLKDRKTGSFMGFVAGPDGQWYQEAVCVTLYSSKNKHAVAETATWGPDFGDGSYAFFDLKPGSYTVEFSDCDDDPFTKFDNVFLGGAAKYANATFVTIAAAEDSQDNSITLSFREANSTISGHIVKPNGTPIAGLAVHASGADSSAVAVTDAHGDYAISGLFNGEYTVSVGGVGTAYVHKDKSVTAVEGGSVTANFSLAKR